MSSSYGFPWSLRRFVGVIVAVLIGSLSLPSLAELVSGGTATASAATPSLAITKTVSATSAAPGVTFRYTIKYRCASITDNCENVTLADVVPAPLEVLSSTGPGGSVSSTNNSGNSLQWNLATPGSGGVLTAGSSGLVTIDVRFPLCGMVGTETAVNTATFAASNAGSVSATAPTVSVSSASSCGPTGTGGFEKTVSGNGDQGWGNAYTVAAPGKPTAYWVTDTMPAGVKISSINYAAPMDINCGNGWFDYYEADRLGLPESLTGCTHSDYTDPAGTTHRLIDPVVQLRWEVAANTDRAVFINTVTTAPRGTTITNVATTSLGETDSATYVVGPVGANPNVFKWTSAAFGQPRPDGLPAGNSALNEVDYQLGARNLVPSDAPLVNPILEDLLPVEVDWVDGQSTWVYPYATYDSPLALGRW